MLPSTKEAEGKEARREKRRVGWLVDCSMERFIGFPFHYPRYSLAINLSPSGILTTSKNKQVEASLMVWKCFFRIQIQRGLLALKPTVTNWSLKVDLPPPPLASQRSQFRTQGMTTRINKILHFWHSLLTMTSRKGSASQKNRESGNPPPRARSRRSEALERKLWNAFTGWEIGI